MIEALNITEAEAQGLTEIAQLDLGLARHFAARAQAAEDDEAANALARTFHRAAHSYRQTLTSKVRLQREIRRLASDAIEDGLDDPYDTDDDADDAAADDTPPPPHVPRDALRIRARAAEVRDAVTRIGWAELGSDDPQAYLSDYDGLVDAPDARLDDQTEDNAFGLEPLDDQVMDLVRDLNLCEVLAGRWRELSPPPRLVTVSSFAHGHYVQRLRRASG